MGTLANNNLGDCLYSGGVKTPVPAANWLLVSLWTGSATVAAVGRDALTEQSVGAGGQDLRTGKVTRWRTDSEGGHEGDHTPLLGPGRWRAHAHFRLEEEQFGECYFVQGGHCGETLLILFSSFKFYLSAVTKRQALCGSCLQRDNSTRGLHACVHRYFYFPPATWKPECMVKSNRWRNVCLHFEDQADCVGHNLRERTRKGHFVWNIFAQHTFHFFFFFLIHKKCATAALFCCGNCPPKNQGALKMLLQQHWDLVGSFLMHWLVSDHLPLTWSLDLTWTCYCTNHFFASWPMIDASSPDCHQATLRFYASGFRPKPSTVSFAQPNWGRVCTYFFFFLG